MSAQGSDTRRQSSEQLTGPSGGAFDSGPVVREFPDSAQGTDTRRQSSEQLTGPSGGAFDSGPAVREFSDSAEGTDTRRQSISLALLSSSTSQFLGKRLRTEMRTWGWDISIWESSFNQYRQAISNSESDLYVRAPAVVILYLEAEDLFSDCLNQPFSLAASDRRKRAQAAALETERWANTILERLPGTVVILNTIFLPPLHVLTGLEYNSQWGESDLAAHYNLELARIAGERHNIICVDVAGLAIRVGYSNWFDPRLWYLARTRLSSEATSRLALTIGTVLRAWKGESKKCVVLDLDNTLWGGIVGEDGIDGILLGEEGLGLAYAEFQQELALWQKRGVLLAICSKNNQADALDAIRRNPYMRLRETDFAAIVINWEDKASNIRAIAKTLNLGLDSFVFIDDNPVERELVRSALPEVFVPEWPSDASYYKTSLLELAAQHFPRFSLTSEDAERTALYRSESNRQQLAAQSGSLEEYYASLEMRAEIGLGDGPTIPRIAQLTQKTNQFNLTTKRYTESDLWEFIKNKSWVVLWLRLKDRFADNGIVGVLLMKQEDMKLWSIDTLLLSCRVIGRSVESAFLAYACRLLIDRGAEFLVGEYVPTKKNGLVANTYRELGFQKLDEPKDGTTGWTLALKAAPISAPKWIEVMPRTETSHA